MSFTAGKKGGVGKRCGILTYHYASNYGAFLQAYSFYIALSRRIPDHKVEFINYEPPNAIRMYLYTFVPWLKYGQMLRELYHFKKNIKLFYQYISFVLARKMFLPTGQKIPYNNLNKAVEKVNKLYDVVVLGSDELWKINSLRPFPNLYWLSKGVSALKMSFAPSANTTDFDSLSNVEYFYQKHRLNLHVSNHSLLFSTPK